MDHPRPHRVVFASMTGILIFLGSKNLLNPGSYCKPIFIRDFILRFAGNNWFVTTTV